MLRPAHFLPQGDAAALQPGPRHHGGPRHGPVTLGIRQPKAQVEKGFSPKTIRKAAASCRCRGKWSPHNDKANKAAVFSATPRS